MPRWREVGNVHNHADGIVSLARCDGAAGNRVTTPILESIGGIVAAKRLAEAEITRGYLDRIGTETWGRISNDIDTELFRTGL